MQLSIADRRVRAASFAAGACVVALACLVLVINSRVRVLLEPPAIQAVTIRIETRPPRSAPVRSAGMAPVSTIAPPTPTILPMARDALHRMQACWSPHLEDRPADCPRLAAPPDWRQSGELPVGGDFYRARPLDLDQAFTRGELMARAVPPPCQLGLHRAVIGVTPAVQYCTHTYPDPPPPARIPAKSATPPALAHATRLSFDRKPWCCSHTPSDAPRYRNCSPALAPMTQRG